MAAGYRFVLTYNLVYEDCNKPLREADIDLEENGLDEIFALWRASANDGGRGSPEMLFYILEHSYTNATLQYDRLKGQDVVIGDYVKELCKKYNFIFWLANFEHGIDGQCYDCYGDEDSWMQLYFSKNCEPDFHEMEKIDRVWSSFLHVAE